MPHNLEKGLKMDDAAVRRDPSLLYRKLNSLFFKRGMDVNMPHAAILKSFLEESLQALGELLHVQAGIIYGESDDSLILEGVFGDPGGAVAERLDMSLPSLQHIFTHRVYIFDNPDSESSPCHDGILPHFPSAAVIFGRRPNRNLLFYVLKDGWPREELNFALNAIRAALGVRSLRERLRGSFKEAAAIQQSLLVDEPPLFEGYDIACKMIPAEDVSGDFYDFLTLSEHILGIAIGDASGHGLPAALLVRDVVTGLRMGIEKDLKATPVFQKLNRVIHRSMLSSRFVSLFYTEIESTGNIVYVNAGHLPPLVFNNTSIESLERGGSVIGPLPEVSFQRGFTLIKPGSLLLMCTDGVTERRNAKGEFFGETRLEHVIRSKMGASAQEILDFLFAAAFDFGEGKRWEDDATAIVVIRR